MRCEDPGGRAPTRQSASWLSLRERRVGRDRQDGAGHGLGDVVEERELGGVDLQVDLEARIRRLEHDRVLLDDQLVRAVNPKLVGDFAQSAERRIQRVVALLGCHVSDLEVLQAQRRKDPRQHDLRAELAGCLVDFLEPRVQSALETGEAVLGERERVEVQLEIEASQIWCWLNRSHLLKQSCQR